jgi:hypothetical protein
VRTKRQTQQLKAHALRENCYEPIRDKSVDERHHIRIVIGTQKYMTKTVQNVALLVAVLVAGCGYVRSGRWTDDPGNWSRSFHSTQPEDVVVVHSLYWRTPHWSSEAGYLFEIQPNEGLRKQLFGENQLTRFPRFEIDEHERPCLENAPRGLRRSRLRSTKSGVIRMILGASFDYSSTRVPGGYSWEIMKSSTRQSG